MRNVLQLITWKRVACIPALAAGIFLGMIVPASPSHATAVPKACALDQRVIRVYYSDPAFLHPVCQDVVSPSGCQTHYCDATPYYKDSCCDTCLL